MLEIAAFLKASLVAFSNVKQLCISKSCLNLEISLQKKLGN